MMNNIFYFPIPDSEDIPQEVREKAEQLIDQVVHTHKLDTSKLHLNVRMVVFSVSNGKWSNEISIVISDGDTCDNGIWVEKEYSIGHEDSLYESFKTYIVKQLEEILFNM